MQASIYREKFSCVYMRLMKINAIADVNPKADEKNNLLKINSINKNFASQPVNKQIITIFNVICFIPQPETGQSQYRGVIFPVIYYMPPGNIFILPAGAGLKFRLLREVVQIQQTQKQILTHTITPKTVCLHSTSGTLFRYMI